ncbi:MAG TPA: hypothetical protein VGO49_14495 [Bradyrhizobium sp.]|jgi:hypothetical protein|nr:hypothetical protein [Bradyrhizobium sp.]
MSTDTDMAVQLFMQSTILLSNYYGYSTIKYAEIRARSRRAGFDVIPFMAPETIRATPELIHLVNDYEDNPARLNEALQRLGGYKNLVKYYIRTGLRASQSICRNYLLEIEEKNEYLQFLQKEIGVAAALSTAVLALVNANSTITTSFLIARTGLDGGIDAYQEYRFLNVDREAARTVVEAAQNALATHFLKQVDETSANPNLVTGGYTFSDALHAVSTIEYQCTRSGIRSLLTRSINNSPSNLLIDPETGMITFRTALGAPVDPNGTAGKPSTGGNTGGGTPGGVGTGGGTGGRGPGGGAGAGPGPRGGAGAGPGPRAKFEDSLKGPDISTIQQALCLTPTGLLGPTDSPTRTAIASYLEARGKTRTQIIDDRNFTFLAEAAEKVDVANGGTCAGKFANAAAVGASFPR